MVVKLTPRQRAFADEYIANKGNATQAYKKAYTNVTKDETARVNGSRMLTNANVSEYIAEIMDEHKQKALWTREQSVNTLKWLLNQSIESVKSEKFDKGYVRQGTANAIVSAVKELNELELLYPLKQAQLEKIKGKPEGETGAIFIESEEEMLRYIENNQHEYDNINK